MTLILKHVKARVYLPRTTKSVKLSGLQNTLVHGYITLKNMLLHDRSKQLLN